MNVSVHQAEKCSLEAIRRFARQQITRTWRATCYSKTDSLSTLSSRKREKGPNRPNARSKPLFLVALTSPSAQPRGSLPMRRTSRSWPRSARPDRRPCGRRLALSAQALRGFRISAGTSGQLSGMLRPKAGSVANSTLSSLPSSAALTSARVIFRLMRLPTPNLPPDQPVLTSQQAALCCLQPLAQHLRVDARGQRQERRAEAGRKLRRRVLDARLRFRPAWPCSRRGSDTSPAPASGAQIGGSTPKASAARNITFFGCPPTPGITAFSMKSTG